MLEKATPFVGPMDHAAPVMTMIDANHAIQAILFGYACHPTTLGFRTWCGDYPGFAQLEIERKIQEPPRCSSTRAAVTTLRCLAAALNCAIVTAIFWRWVLKR